MNGSKNINDKIMVLYKENEREYLEKEIDMENKISYIKIITKQKRFGFVMKKNIK